MVLPRTEAEYRVKEALCVSPNSQPSQVAVADLKALPPAGQADYFTSCAKWDLPNQAGCALAANISADTRFGEDEEDTPVLCVAALNGSARVLRLLLDGGANVKLTNKRGWTAAHAASFRGHAESLRILLAAGADKEAKEERGFRPLHSGAQHGHAEVVEVLLSGGCAVDARSNEQVTPLQLAAQYGHRPVVQQLLLRGASPKARCILGNTPLMGAVIYDHAPCVAELLPVSALSIRDAQGRTIFHVCAINGNIKCFELLLPLMSDVAWYSAQW
jgi:ankyrin repeat protein